MLTLAPRPTSARRQQLLAALLERRGLKVASDRIPRRSHGGAAALSSGQRRLWLMDRVAPGNPVYNVPACFRISGRLDLQAFKAAIDEIVGRHEILRTRFSTDGGDVVQIVAPRLPVAIALVDCSDIDPEACTTDRYARV